MGTAAMPRIGFKAHLRAEHVPGEGVCVISANGTTLLSGASIEALGPLLDGSRTLAEIVRQASPRLSARQVGCALGRLTAANLIGYRQPASGDRDTAAEAYWDQIGQGGQGGRARTTTITEIVALGRIDATRAAEYCRSSGLAVREAGGPAADFSLVLCDDYLDGRLAAINARYLAERRCWLLARPVGVELWIGPVFRPGDGPCWSCLANRLERHRRSVSVAGPAIPDASLPASRELGLRAAVLEAVKWTARIRYEGQDSVWILDTGTLSARFHRIDRRPQCPACGDPGMVAARVQRPVVPASSVKAAAAGNGHRALTLEQITERYGHLIDPVTGIVDEVRRDPRCPDGVHAYLSGPNLALAPGSLAAMRAELRAQSGGKGATDLEARVSALCEAVERYCGSRSGDEPTVRDSFRGLGSQAVHPDTCQLFHERQFRARERWNATTAAFHHVPEPFDERAAIDWTPVWSLTGQRQRLLPTALLYFGGNDPGSAFVRADSNGNAAGGTLEDAIVQGFLELVERDAVALWWYNRTRQPAVDPWSFDHPWYARSVETYARMNREIWVLDITSDLGIPVMAAISRRTDKPAEDIMFGFGAHFDPWVALRRAVTELGQLVPAVAGARSDGTGYAVPNLDLLRWWRTATTQNQPYLLPDPEPAARQKGDYGYVPRADLLADIDHIRALARENDMEVLVLDQTRPDVGMPVTKVVVPGLRHFWARFASGRLFDVPVRLGRLAAATSYERLNPIPLFV